jgi:PilZ domain-containing protein
LSRARLSPAGARLIFPAAVTLPDIVELYIPHKDETYRCQVQWHRGDEIGVAFNREEAGNAPPASFVPEAGLAERMQQLETEIVALRNIIKELKSEQGGRNSDVAFTVRSASGKV